MDEEDEPPGVKSPSVGLWIWLGLGLGLGLGSRLEQCALTQPGSMIILSFLFVVAVALSM